MSVSFLFSAAAAALSRFLPYQDKTGPRSVQPSERTVWKRAGWQQLHRCIKIGGVIAKGSARLAPGRSINISGGRHQPNARWAPNGGNGGAPWQGGAFQW